MNTEHEPDDQPNTTQVPPAQKSHSVDPTPATPSLAQQYHDAEKRMTTFERSMIRWTGVSTGIAVLAAIFICLQWVVMRNTLEEMKRSGDASANQLWQAIGNMNWMARTADGSLHQTREAMEANKLQSAASLNATIEQNRLDQRAWVGQISIQIDAPEVGKSIKGYINWQNSGKTFARQVMPSCYVNFVAQQFPNEKDLIKTASTQILVHESIAVLFPGGQYKTIFDSKSNLYTELDKERISGSWYTYVWGELTYRDIFMRPHKTKFCSFRQGSTGDFIQCPYHNDAE